MTTITKQKRVLSVFSLVMINVIAVDNLRSLPVSAEYGFALVFYYLLAGLVFMIPSALVAAELATGWPNKGGAYVWVREAFGKRASLLATWLQWIYNVVWYPTMLAFLAGISAYLIDPRLANDKLYMLSVILVMFWLATLINSFNMKTSSLVSTLGALIGTFVPMLSVSILGILWLVIKQNIQIDFSLHDFLPSFHNMNNLAFLTAVLFGLMGMEMSAVHAEEVKNPQHDYPKALLYSSIIILSTLILASLAIAIVVPHTKINLVDGLIVAFSIFFKDIHLPWLTPVLAVTIVIGGLGGISTWVIGPTKALLVASQDGSIPPLFQKSNKNNMPIALLIGQAIFVSLISLIFLFMPTVNSSYWILTALTAQLALIYYIFLFATAIKLRYSHPDKKRTYKIPGGKLGIWITSGVGIIACIAVIIFGFFPPVNIDVGNIYFFEAFLSIGIVIFCLVPLLLYQLRKPHWRSENE